MDNVRTEQHVEARAPNPVTDIAVRRAASRLIAVGGVVALVGCGTLMPSVGEQASGLHRAETMAVARSLGTVPDGEAAPWTEIATDAVGTARFVGEGAGHCRPAEIMRWRSDQLDTLRMTFCQTSSGWVPEPG